MNQEAQVGDVLYLDMLSYYYPCTYDYDCRSDIPVMTQGLWDLADAQGIQVEVHWWYLNQFEGFWPYEY